MRHMDVRIALATFTAALALAASTPVLAVEQWTHNFATGWASHYVRATGDVNGDGLADLIGFGYHDTFISLSSGSAFLPSKVGVHAFGQGSWNQQVYPLRVADVNGDGRDDIIGFGYHDVFVATSTGNGFNSPRVAYGGFTEGDGWRMNRHERLVGDVTGDGRADIVAFGHYDVFVAPSNGSTFSGASSWGQNMVNHQGFYSDRYQRMLGDVNGDGRMDAIAVANSGIRVMLSQGNRFGSMYTAHADLGVSQRGSVFDHPRAIADVNGDGRADLVAFLTEGVYVALSNGHDFTGGTVRLDDYGANAGWTRDHWRFFADVDGDAMADVIGVHDETVRVSRADGDGRFEDKYEPLSGGDFVTRFEQAGKGLCLSVSNTRVYQRPCDADHPYGWVLEERADSSYLLKQDGKCLLATNFGGDVIEYVEAREVSCGQPGSGWLLERTRHGMMRLRNARNGQCLRVASRTTSDMVPADTMRCDASINQLYRVDTLRPRTMQTPLRAAHSDKCATAYVGGVVSQQPCDGRPEQQMTFTDDGHGGYTIRNDALGLCFSPHAANGAITGVACAVGDGPRWALEVAETGRRFVISKSTGRCLDVSGHSVNNGARVQSWSCHGQDNQQWQMPEMASSAIMTISLQNVGGEGGTMLVISNAFGGYVVRDPVGIISFLRAIGHPLAFDATVLNSAQRIEFEGRVGGWNVELPLESSVSAEILVGAAGYDVGLDGVSMGLSTTAASGTIELGGVAQGNARVLDAEASLTLRRDGFELSPSANVVAVSGGFGNRDRSYAGLSAGYGTKGFSTAARWGQNGQYGATVPMVVVAVDLYVHGDDVMSAAMFARDVGEWVADAAVEVFSSAWGWTGGAFGTAVGAVSNILGDAASVLEDVGDAIVDGFSSGFGLW